MKSFFTKLITGLLMAGSFFSTAQGNAQDPKTEDAPLVLILLGPPGSGKGTQAQLIKDKFHLAHISTGDLLRENIRQGTSLGKQAKEYMDAGKLVPDELIFDLLFARTAQKDCQMGYILDGFPRTLPQAEMLVKKLPKNVHPLVINLSLADQKIIERLTQRLTCEKCGAPYHMTASPSKKPGVCDRCNGNLIQRSDDTEAVITKRLSVYHDQTSPLIRFYEKLHSLHTVSCELPKEKVFEEISHLLTEEKKEHVHTHS